MSPFKPASAPSSSFFSLSGTLNLSRVLIRSSTRALNSPAVLPMFLWAVFISRPVYWHGPPVAKQTKSLRLASRRLASVLANFLLMRASASTFPAKSSTTAEIASLPPRRSNSDEADPVTPPFAPSGGAGLKLAGRDKPVADDSLSTMSPLNPPNAPSNSFLSFSGTLNLFRVLTRSSTSALNSPAVVPIFLWALFISRPVYWHGPPVAKQTKSLRLVTRRFASLMANFLLMRASASTFPAKSSTTAEIASLPPRRSYSDFDEVDAATAPFAPSGGAGLKAAGRDRPVAPDSLSTMSPLNPPNAPSNSFFSFSGTLNLFRVLTRSSTSALNSPAVVPIFLWALFISRPVYWHGPPVAKQTKSLRLVTRRFASLMANFLLMRASASTFPAKSLTTAEIASLPPRRSYSDFDVVDAATVLFAPSGGAGLKLAGRFVPVVPDSLSTMSPLNLANAPSSSLFSLSGTLNLFRVLTRSSTSALNSPDVVPIFL